jgi:hypothetical protein
MHTHTTHTTPITRAAVAQQLAAARALVENNRAWFNALNKAAVELEASAWSWNGQQLTIASRTTKGTRYTVTSAACPCKAGQAGRPCWHRAAARLIERVSEASSKAQSRAAAQQAVDELFA